MRYCQLSVLSVLTFTPFCNLAKSLTPHWDDMLTKHTWNTVPTNWETLGHPSAGSTIDLHFILKPHHEHALIDALYEVSVPGSPKYGAHLSIEQVAQLVAPHPDTVELINSWLEHHDVPTSSISTTRGGSWITITDVPVSQANKMLGASYQSYRRTGTNETTILRTIRYGLPAVLHNHVQTVVPTTYFAPSRPPWQTTRSRTVGKVDVVSRKHLTGLSSRDGDETDIKITPSELRSLYGTAAYVPAAKDRNKLGVLGMQGDYPSEDDLRRFMTAYREDGIEAAYEVVQINGGEYEPENPDGEANLSVQYAEALTFPTPLVFYSVGGQPMFIPDTGQPRDGDHWFEWLRYLVNQPSVPQTLSSVYGNMEKDVPQEYAATLCNMFCDLGARGVSILFASGNFGVGHDCVELDEDGNVILDHDGNEIVNFTPTFPGTCPCVTSVGGTTYEGYMMRPEVAASQSGGGFSNYFDRPDYQNEVVPSFLDKLGSNLEGFYNATSRGFPDISAQAEAFLIRLGEYNYVVGGTSCATPTVASIISLLNDYRLFLGRRPLGFLNPWLYGRALRGINDITSGSNPGCGTDGFEATIGWDPVTGLGTPNFLILKDVIDNEPEDEPEGDEKTSK